VQNVKKERKNLLDMRKCDKVQKNLRKLEREHKTVLVINPFFPNGELNRLIMGLWIILP